MEDTKLLAQPAPKKKKTKWMEDAGKKPKAIDNEKALKMYNDRRTNMQSWRTQFEADWDTCDKQVASRTYYKDGILQVNPPMEQNIIEMAVGRYAGKTTYNLEPIGEPNVDEIMPAKYILDHFLVMGGFHEEKKQWRLDKATYGTAIFFCGITYECSYSYDIKDGSDAESIRDTNYVEKKNEEYIMTPVNVPLRHFWIDERALSQPMFTKARDCIMQETISLEEFQARYKNKGWFEDIKDIKESDDADPAYGNDLNVSADAKQNVILHHYMNRITKDYFIVANQKDLVYKGKLLYKHNRLPFVLKQHYPRNNCMYGRGIPHKVRYLKAYKAEMLQGLLDKVRLSSGINLGMGNETSVDGDLYTASGEINIWRFTGGIDQVRQFQMDGNINGYSNAIQMLDDMVIQDTGENVKAPYSSPASTLWETEIIEENKMVRVQAVNEADDMGIWEALTMALDNITQFAPKLLRTIKTLESGAVIECFPTITVPDVELSVEEEKYSNETEEMEWEKEDDSDDQYGKVKKAYNKYKIVTKNTEDYGNYGTFEFKPDIIKSRFRIKVTTPSTWNSLQAIQKNSITQYLQNKMMLWQVKPDLVENEDRKGLMDLLNLVYGYDDKFMATTRKSEIKQANMEMINRIYSLINNDAQNPTLQKPREITEANAWEAINNWQATGVTWQATGANWGGEGGNGEIQTSGWDGIV
jgi:hypothetical protein